MSTVGTTCVAADAPFAIAASAAAITHADARILRSPIVASPSGRAENVPAC
jgi:hypothetical protein